MHDFAVVVGKFQSPEPTEAHINLLKKTYECAHSVLVFIGSNQIKTEIDLIPFQVRKDLIIDKLFNEYSSNYSLTETLEIIQSFKFIEIVDVFNKETWSLILDVKINDNIKEGQSVILLGGRDSFLDSYCGKFIDKEYVSFECGDGISATKARLECKKSFLSDPMFIKGAFYHALNQYPIAYQTVDVFIRKFHINEWRVVLGRKKNESKLVFIGGFSEPTSPSLEFDALKEVFEEAGYTGNKNSLKYICSTLVDDPRYAKSMHKIKTAMFELQVPDDATFVAGDDIEDIVEIPLNSLSKDLLMNKHHKLFDLYRENGVI